MEKIKRNLEWVGLYKNGQSCYQIAKSYNVSKHTVWHVLKRMGVKRRTTSEATASLPANEIITAYKNGASARQLTNKYNSTITSITDLLKRHNIKVRPSERTKADWSFIYKIDNFFLYWLGWVLTDGCVSYVKYEGRNRGVKIELSVQTKDVFILEFFRDKIYPEIKIKRKKRTRCYNLAINIPRKDADYLESWGLIPRKSLTLAPTKKLYSLKNEEFWQLFMSLIEGDGYITTRRGEISYCSASKKWICFIKNKLSEYTTSNIFRNGSCYHLRLNKTESNKLFHQHLKKAEYRLLNRKWNKLF